MRLRSVVLAAAGLALAASGSAPARTATCVLPQDATLVRASPSMVLYRRPNTGESSYRLVGCLRATNRRRVVSGYLGVVADYGDSTARRPLAIRTAGRFVAMLVSSEEPRHDFYGVNLQVIDLASGRSATLSVNASRSRETVHGLLLSANGRVAITVDAVAYAPSGVPEPGLWSVQGGKYVALEACSGPFDDTAVTKEGVRWTSPTGAHSVPLAPALGGVLSASRRLSG